MCAAAAAARALAPARMYAWRVHAYGSGLSELRLDEARAGVLRAPTDLLVRVHHASLNPLDLNMLEGYGRRVLGAWRRLERAAGGQPTDGEGALPLTPGRDFCGQVVRAGPAALARPGALVWGVVPPHRDGSHAQYVVVRDQWTGALPERLVGAGADSGAGGALYAGLSALALIRAAGIDVSSRKAAGARVLLLGVGGVGQAALQLLAAAGVSVTVLCSADCVERALRLGAADAIDRRAPDCADRLNAAAGGGRYRAALDAAGRGGAGAAGLPAARYATLTSPALRNTDERGLAAGVAASALTLAQQNAGACADGPVVCWAYFSPSAADIALLARRVQDGQLVIPVERSYAWWRARDAYERAAQGSARGKIMLDFTLRPDHH